MMAWMLLANVPTIGIAIAPASNAAPARKMASPFDGEWRIEYPCDRATGVFAQRCAEGQRDVMDFNLVARSGKLCGTGEVTAQLGNHVDDSASIIGNVHGDVATANWNILNSHGTGTMKVRGRTLVFHSGPWTPDKGKLTSFPPGETTILTRIGDADPKLAICASPNTDGA